MIAAANFPGPSDGYSTVEPAGQQEDDSAATESPDEFRLNAYTPELSGCAFKLLRDLIHDRTGLFYDDSRRGHLADKLARRLAERRIDSFLDYYYVLRYDTAAATEEWRMIANELCVPETYFWREMDAIRALVDVVVPRHFAEATAGPLRIWSAACCTGEEPLTIAIALQEARLLERHSIRITASDASPASIARARKGVYRGRAFRCLPDALHEKYFLPDEEGERISPTIHARVTWSVANLLSPEETVPLATADVVFCRNVFIYFSRDSIRRVLQVLHDHMSSPGYLFVGTSESLLKVTNDFELEEIGGAFVYLKR